jgi:hypothetical protein
MKDFFPFRHPPLGFIYGVTTCCWPRRGSELAASTGSGKHIPSSHAYHSARLRIPCTRLSELRGHGWTPPRTRGAQYRTVRHPPTCEVIMFHERRAFFADFSSPGWTVSKLPMTELRFQQHPNNTMSRHESHWPHLQKGFVTTKERFSIHLNMSCFGPDLIQLA